MVLTSSNTTPTSKDNDGTEDGNSFAQLTREMMLLPHHLNLVPVVLHSDMPCCGVVGLLVQKNGKCIPVAFRRAPETSRFRHNEPQASAQNGRRVEQGDPR